MGAWSRFLDAFFNWRLIERYSPDILKGTVVTIEIAVAVVVTGILFGLALAIVRAFRVLTFNTLIVIFVDMFRALPPLVLILLVYFGLPNIGINLPSFAVLWLVLTLVLAAFAEEIFWAGILSIPKGQWEAARSTGLSFLRTLVYIVVPQAIRLTVPPLTNRTIAITKNTAIGTVIGVGEILNQATSAQSFFVATRHL
jgi:polar amino acid transport system permease protein